MKRVLVTGAHGFIGRHCLRILAEKGYEVHAVSRQCIAEASSPGAQWHECDLLKPGCPSQLIGEVCPDAVLHLAWCTEHGKFWQSEENVEWVRASLELLSSFTKNGGKRFVAAGSCAEYDRHSGECVENSTPLLPASLYGSCKRAMFQILEAWSLQTRLEFAWGRVFHLYGPYEHPDRIVAYVIRSLLAGTPAVCSDGGQTLDFLHVEDVASAFVRLLESGVSGPVNIGSGKPSLLRDVLLEIGQQMSHSELVHLGVRRGNSDPDRIWANTIRLRKEAGWRPSRTLEAGLQQTIEWWSAQNSNANPSPECVPKQPRSTPNT